MFVQLFVVIICLAVFTTGATAQSRSPEVVFWESVKDTGAPAELEAYLKAYPSGTFSALARIRLKNLRPAAVGKTTGQPSDKTTSGKAEKLTIPVRVGRLKGGNQAWFGVRISNVTRDVAGALGIDEGWGVLVLEVAPSSPAFKAGIHPWDVLVEFDSWSITAIEDLPLALASASPGQRADAVIWRAAPTFDDLLDRLASRAGTGKTDAMVMLGRIHEAGFAVAKNPAEAVRWYRKAADRGHAEAMANLGLAYANGRGVAKDEAEAVRWYRKAADKGHAPAMNNLGTSYVNGTGVAKNMNAARKWIGMAADNGYADAFFSLGWMYDKGRGVKRDSRLAARHVFDALRKGSTYAARQMTTNAARWSSPFRRELQRLLGEAGVYNGSIDGKFGPGTRGAIGILVQTPDTGRNEAPKITNTQSTPMVVAIPELNIFSQPDVSSNQLGALRSGDRVEVQQWWNDNASGEKWARICAGPGCGWVGAEFLAVAASGADDDIFVDLPDLEELEKLE